MHHRTTRPEGEHDARTAEVTQQRRFLAGEQFSMREAEHHAARAATACAEADAEGRHRDWMLEAESSHRDATNVLRSELDSALAQKRAMPNEPCEGTPTRGE